MNVFYTTDKTMIIVYTQIFMRISIFSDENFLFQWLAKPFLLVVSSSPQRLGQTLSHQHVLSPFIFSIHFRKIFLQRRRESNSYAPCGAQDFKSGVSTYSTTTPCSYCFRYNKENLLLNHYFILLVVLTFITSILRLIQHIFRY